MIAAIVHACLSHLDLDFPGLPRVDVVPDWAIVTMIDRAEMACYTTRTYAPDRVERICARAVALCFVEWRRGKLARVVHEAR